MGIIKKQGIVNSIITFLGIGIGFISLTILQPIFLTKEELGLTRILFTTAYLVSSIIPLGATNIITRYFPRFKNEAKGHHGFLGFIFCFVFVGYIIAVSLIFIFKPFIISQYQAKSPLFTEYYLWLVPFSLLLSIVTVLSLYCYALYKTYFASLLNDIIVRVLSVILFTIYFLKIIPLDTMIALFVGIYGFQAIALIIFIIKEKAFNLKIDFDFLKSINIKSIIFYSLVFTIAPTASYGIKFIDSIVMAKYQLLGMVGVYAIAAFIPTFIEAPLTALEKLANAKIADALNRNDIENIKDIYYKSCRYMMAIGGLLLLLIYTNVGYLLSFLPEGFSAGTNAALIISLSSLFNLYTGTNNSLIFNSSSFLFGTLLLLLVMILNLCLSIWLIPMIGIEGAACANALAGFSYNLFKFLFIKYKFKLQPYDFRNVKIALITALSVCVLFCLPEAYNLYFSAIYKTLTVSLVYVGLIYISKAITIQEIMK